MSKQLDEDILGCLQIYINKSIAGNQIISFQVSGNSYTSVPNTPSKRKLLAKRLREVASKLVKMNEEN